MSPLLLVLASTVTSAPALAPAAAPDLVVPEAASGAPAPASEPVTASTPAPASALALAIPDGARAAPDFDVARATDAYLATLSPEARARSDAYFEGGYWLLLWRTLVTLAAVLVLLATGLSRRMRDVAERWTQRRWLQTALYAVGFVIALSVLTFPLSLYEGFFRERAYGLLNQELGEWLGDQLTALAVSTVFATLLLTAVYAVIRRAPRTWWLWGSGIAVAFLVFALFLAPVYVMPLFNRYEPLPAGQARDEILSLARANGVPAGDVYVYDGSRQSSRVTANVSGFLSTLRISASDTLFDRSPPETVRAVVGHELAHYVLNHGALLLLELGLVMGAALAFVAWAFARVHRRAGGRWGVRDVADPAGLPILWALLTVFFFVATPVTNGIVRSAESEADIFGLNAAREPDGFAFAAVQLSEYRKMDPGPLEELVFYDHPSGRARIEMAMRWKAESLRRAPRTSGERPSAGLE